MGNNDIFRSWVKYCLYYILVNNLILFCFGNERLRLKLMNFFFWQRKYYYISIIDLFNIYMEFISRDKKIEQINLKIVLYVLGQILNNLKLWIRLVQRSIFNRKNLLVKLNLYIIFCFGI